MIEDMTVRNLSPATQRSYLMLSPKFSRHFGRSPERLGMEDVRAFQVHWSPRAFPGRLKAVCALRFFYGVTLGARDSRAHRLCAPAAQLPVVLSEEEVARFCRRSRDCKSRGPDAAYAAGLRASEVRPESRRYRQRPG